MKLAICLMVFVVCTSSGVLADVTEADPNADYVITGVPGGLFAQDPNSNEMKEKAKEILLLFDDSNTFGLAQRIRSIKSAQAQVVAGMVYYLVIDVGLLNCTEKQAAAINFKCKITKAADCTFKYYEEPFEGIKEIMSSECGKFVSV